MSEPYEQLALLMNELEQEMRRVGLWSITAPSPQALASTFPFCFDTLQFSEWLQWVFRPKVLKIIEQRGRLPGKCDITPMAETWFEENDLKATACQLLVTIAALDRLLSSDSA